MFCPYCCIVVVEIIPSEAESHREGQCWSENGSENVACAEKLGRPLFRSSVVLSGGSFPWWKGCRTDRTRPGPDRTRTGSVRARTGSVWAETEPV
ncbi:unnamed protein product [Arctogadus glacialis]